MKIKIEKIFSSVLIAAFASLAVFGSAAAGERKIAIFAIGDSLTAGTQDATTIAATQVNSWISQLAHQTDLKYDVEFVNPWLNVKGERTNRSDTPTNVAIPGLEVQDALSESEVIPLIEGVSIATGPFLEPISGSGPIAPVEALAKVIGQTSQPGLERWVFVWVGSNNSLFDFTRVENLNSSNIDQYMLPPSEFAKLYDDMITRVAAESSDALFVITIPDVLRSGFLFNLDDISFFTGEKVPANLIDPNSLIPLNVAAPMIMGAQAGISIDILIGNLTPAEYLDSSEAALIRERTAKYNEAILESAGKAGAIVIDSDEMLNVWLRNGADIGGRRITRTWGRGGIFSLDGIHPSNTGHALIANAVIDRVNAVLSAEIPKLDINEVYDSDPYRDSDGDGLVAGPSWKPPEGGIAAILRVFVDNDDSNFKKPPW